MRLEIQKLNEITEQEIKLENEKLNHQINKHGQQIKIKKLETKDVLYELALKQQTKESELNELEKTKEKIEQKQQELKASNLKFTANNIALDKLNENIDFINNISFSQNLVNTINNRDRKTKIIV
jgi:hypothetical protein